MYYLTSVLWNCGFTRSFCITIFCNTSALRVVQSVFYISKTKILSSPRVVFNAVYRQKFTEHVICVCVPLRSTNIETDILCKRRLILFRDYFSATLFKQTSQQVCTHGFASRRQYSVNDLFIRPVVFFFILFLSFFLLYVSSGRVL